MQASVNKIPLRQELANAKAQKPVATACPVRDAGLPGPPPSSPPAGPFSK